MAKRAAKISIFPDTLLRKNQLMIGLAAAGNQIFAEAAEQHRIMLRDPYAAPLLHAMLCLCSVL